MTHITLALLLSATGVTGFSRGPLSASAQTAGFYNVVCIGDSITTGGVAGALPYSTTLRTAISTAKTRYASVWNAGVSGNKTSDMLTRWSGGIRGSQLSVVVVLGGVNDANADVAAATTFANLQTIYDNAHADGLYVVAMTIMPQKNFVSWTSGHQTLMDTVNASIRSYVAANPSNTALVDLYALMGSGDPAVLNATYDSGDGLHPNSTGEAFIGTRVATALGF